MTYAGFWKRFAAFLVDMTIVWFFAGLIWNIPLYVAFISHGIDSTNPEELGLFIDSFYDDNALLLIISFLIVPIIIGVFYYAIFESSRRQATPGKILLKLKVTDQYGQRISFGRAAGRFIIKYVLGFFTFQFIHVAVAMTRKKQGLHDLMVDTLVINNTEQHELPYEHEPQQGLDQPYGQGSPTVEG